MGAATPRNSRPLLIRLCFYQGFFVLHLFLLPSTFPCNVIAILIYIVCDAYPNHKGTCEYWVRPIKLFQLEMVLNECDQLLLVKFSGTSPTRSPKGLGKNDLNVEVTVLQGANIALLAAWNTIICD